MASGLYSQPSTKLVTVYTNGEQFVSAKSIVASPKKTRTWDVFLESVTSTLKTREPIKRLCATDGTRIDDFESLKSGETYVAVQKGKKFKRLE